MDAIRDLVPSTKTWLKIMLWAIAAGAFFGVTAVLFAPTEIVFRTVGTCFLVAFSALLMIALCALVDRQKTRNSGLLGMAVLIAVFFLLFALIWSLTDFVAGILGVNNWLVTEGFGLTIVALLATGIPSMIFLYMLHGERFRIAGFVGLGLAGLTILLLTAGIHLHVFGLIGWLFREKLIHTGLWVGTSGILVVGCLVGWKGRQSMQWIWAGVASAAAACLLAVSGVWLDVTTKVGENIVAVLLTVAAVVCYANLLLLLSTRDEHRWIVRASIGSAAITGALIALLIILGVPMGADPLLDFIGRIVTAGLILCAAGALATIILARMHKPLAIEITSERISEVTVVCPMCRTRQTLATGRSVPCRLCGLHMEIKVSEPRCPKCDYLLFHINSTNCPECGWSISAPPETDAELDAQPDVPPQPARNPEPLG